jgi:Fe-S oxidoreductase
MITFSSPKFSDPKALETESLRVYEICNGCRRCFNLCPSFDVLFRGIDEKDGEVGALPKSVSDRVVDLCYYCKLCFNHCPYCPPHAFNLDFPRLMLWGKYLKAKEKRPSLRDRLLVHVEWMGLWGGLAAPWINRALRLSAVRRLLETLLGIHRERLFPDFHRQSFSSWFRRMDGSDVPGKASKEKVALFYGCYVNRHDPEIGKATLQVLEKNNVEVICPEQQCCGMPYFDTGDLDTVRRNANSNLKALGAAVDAGYRIVSPMPTCSLMLKKEYPDLIPTDEARKVADNTYDLCEYLMRLDREGKLSRDFVASPGKIAYQVPCHLRDQNIGLKSRDLMKLIPGTTVEVIERCSGHDGTFGVKKEYYELSLKVGRKAFSAIEEAEPDLVASDCPLAGLALTQSTGKKSVHPVQILKDAYGL